MFDTGRHHSFKMSIQERGDTTIKEGGLCDMHMPSYERRLLEETCNFRSKQKCLIKREETRNIFDT